MTLNELLQEFQSLPFVSLVGNIDFNRDLLSEADKAIFPNLELFEVPFFEVQGETAVKRTIYVYVLDRGTENEVAKWKDGYPQPMTRKNDIKQKYADLIEQYGRVVEEGSNYVIVEGYILNESNQYTKKRYLIDEGGNITEVI